MTLTTIVFLNSVKNLLSNDKMAELLILFLILLCIVLIVSGIMYKCTDGTMNASDFSFKGCFSFGDGSDDKPQEDKSATEEVTASPLLSDSSSMGNLIGSGSIDNEDDEGEVDYSSYMDYYKSSTTPVRAREEILQVCRGIRDNKSGGCGADPVMVDTDPPIKIHIDYLDVDAKNGVGECAKICYDQDETIDGKACNAFQMNNDNKKCRLFWSQSESVNNGGRTNKVYRLKTTRGSADHESEIESKYYNGSNVITFSSTGYKDTKYEFYLGQYNVPHEQGVNSIIIPEDKCVLGFSDKDLGGKRLGSSYFGMDTSRTTLDGSGNPTPIKSVDIGSWEDGICTWYPRDATAAEEDGTATIDMTTSTADTADQAPAADSTPATGSCRKTNTNITCRGTRCSEKTDAASCNSHNCCTWS